MVVFNSQLKPEQLVVSRLGFCVRWFYGQLNV